MTDETRQPAIPEGEWVWCGYPGHFIASSKCRFHLHTRVGRWRISTVGDYWPYPLPGQEPKQDTIGFERFYETAIVEVEGHGEHGEGVVVGDHWIYGYEGEDATVADRGHMEWCQRVAEGWTPDDGEPADFGSSGDPK